MLDLMDVEISTLESEKGRYLNVRADRCRDLKKEVDNC
jgi:hypothetical protein